MVERCVDVLAASCALFARSLASGELEVIAVRGLSAEWSTVHRHILGDGPLPAARAFTAGEAEWLGDAALVAEQYPETSLLGREVSALAALPLTFGTRVLGALVLGFASPQPFGSDERALLETFPTQAAQALDRAGLYAREVAARQRLEALASLAQALASATTTEDVVPIIVEGGKELVGADICALYSLDESTGALELLGQRGLDPAFTEQVRRIPPNGDDPAHRVVATDETRRGEGPAPGSAVLPDITGSPLAGAPAARAFWNQPLFAEGRPVGMLAMGFHEARRFLPEDREFVDTFTRYCAETMLRARRVDAERRARRLAESLQESLTTTLRSIGDAVITTDARGRITLMNGAAEALTGWNEQDARGRDLSEVFDIWNEETHEPSPSPVDRVLQTGAVVGLANHTILRARDGREIAIDDSGAPIRDRSGNIEGVVLVFRDVSKRKRDEQRQSFLVDAAVTLAESLDYAETLSRVARLAVPRLADLCAVDIVDEAGVPKLLAVTHVDEDQGNLLRELRARRFPDLEYGIESVIRSGRSELYPELPDELFDLAALDPDHRRRIRELRLRSAMIVPLVARQTVLGTISFAFADSGRRYDADDLRFAEDVARRCAIALDNARLCAAEQRARHVADVANRAKDEFLATVSHELRTPLNAIVGWAKMMASAKLDAVKTEHAVRTIERNSIAMARLIEDLLDVSRIISGKMRLNVQTVDVARTAEAAIESVKPSAEARGIRVVHSIAPDVGVLIGDPTRLQQVVWNLLSNAVKFTGKGGRVDVSVERGDSAIEIVVRDTGKGIAPQFLPYIFDPFRQEDGTTTRSRGGLGLGLAITRQLVELHGGSVVASSEGEGKGATFVVRIPVTTVVARGDEHATAGAARHVRSSTGFQRPPQLQGLSVLVVDDEEDARQLLKAILDACGSHVIVASSAEEAMEAIQREPVDVLISDIGMPEHDGYDLIHRVRALPADRGGTMPAAALTAYASAADRRRVLQAGFTMHVPKPVDPAELISVVASLTRFGARPEKS